MSTHDKSLSYKDAGVNIDAGNQLVEEIKHLTRPTLRPEVLAGVGGFSALYELPAGKYHQPVIVSATDGVGTKLKLALELGVHDTVGIDLVAMCANDLVVIGAEPLFFLDYYATGRLDVSIAADVIKGIAQGCLQAGCSLVGGETAEMPGMYQHKDYDIAGFCVGAVEKADILNPQLVQAGDVLIGLASSGVHSNGFSLVRHILTSSNTSLHHTFGDKTIGEVLLTPTKIYVKSILALTKAKLLHSCAHITGGGLLDNIPRVLPGHLQATIQASSWQRPEIFQWLQKQGNVEENEMLRTFNNGVGMVLCVDPKNVAAVLESLKQSGETAFIMGEIQERKDEKQGVVLVH